MDENRRSSGGSDATTRIRQASRRPATLGATPEGAIALSMGEPDSGTPQHIVEEAIRALRAGRTKYTNLTGAPALRAALAGKLSAEVGREIEAEQVVVTHGGSAGLAASMLALVNKGERVLIPEPSYSLYADHAAMVGAEAVWVANKPDGTLDIERLAQEASSSRMIILCNPGNPTGRVFSPNDLERLAEVLARNPEILLLADEAYSDIIFTGAEFRSALALAKVADQVVLCSTFSKTYAMTGWRIGYVVAAPEIAGQINLLHRSLNGSINTFVQDAALVALETPKSDLRKVARSYEDRRDIVLEYLNDIEGLTLLTPQGAFYAFIAVDSDLTSDEMTARFAEGGVIVRSGSEFGPSGEGYVRISFATDPDSLHAGLERFVRVVQDLRRTPHAHETTQRD